MNILIAIAALFLLIPIILYFFKTLTNPFWIVVLIPSGALMGYWAQIARGATIPFSLFQVLLIASFLSFILHRIIIQDFIVRRTNFEVEFLLLLTLISFSMIYTPNYHDSFLDAFRVLVLILMVYLVVNTFVDIKQFRLTFFLLVSMATVLSILSLWDGLLRPEAAIWNYILAAKKLAFRTQGNYGDPNVFASQFFLPISFAVSIAMVKNQKMHYRIIGVVLYVIFFLAIIPTFSRSAWISIFVSSILLAILFKQYKIFIWLFIVGLIALIFVPHFQFLFMSVLKRIVDIFAGSKDVSSSIRMVLGIGALRMFFDSYLIGVGFRGFPDVITQYASNQELLGVLEPHNISYTILAELGLLGFLLFLWIFGKIGYIAYQNFRHSSTSWENTISGALLASYTSILVFYQFYPDGLVSNKLWLTVGLILSLQFYLNRKGQSESKFHRERI